MRTEKWPGRRAGARHPRHEEPPSAARTWARDSGARSRTDAIALSRVARRAPNSGGRGSRESGAANGRSPVRLRRLTSRCFRCLQENSIARIRAAPGKRAPVAVETMTCFRVERSPEFSGRDGVVSRRSSSSPSATLVPVHLAQSARGQMDAGVAAGLLHFTAITIRSTVCVSFLHLLGARGRPPRRGLRRPRGARNAASHPFSTGCYEVHPAQECQRSRVGGRRRLKRRHEGAPETNPGARLP